MTLRECFEKNLLKRIPPDPERSAASLKLAAHYLQRAEGNLKLEFYDVVLLMSYASMLQAARALLFKDGVKERSHGCVVAYLRETHPKIAKEAEILDHYRQNRHIIQYEGGQVSREDAATAIKDCRLILDAIKRLLK